MATRPYFLIDNNDKIFIEKFCSFTYYTGFAISQKQKSISSFHTEIKKVENNDKILEISSKSKTPLGVKLSAFNLEYYDKQTQESHFVENWFQASKIFENGGPFTDLLKIPPRQIKKDERLKTSGKLIMFKMNNTKWELIPRTMFYDYLYISALMQNKELSQEIIKYDIFTDIEFNPKKSVNCQARAVAIFVSLYKRGLLKQYLENKKLFETIYTNKIKKQLQLFQTAY